MLRKVIHFLSGVGVGILLISVIFLSSYYNLYPRKFSAGINGGFVGGIMGTLVVFALRGKAKMFYLGLNTFWLVLCFIILVFGLVVFPREHPLGSLIAVLMALPGIVFFGIGFWIIPKRAKEAELRRLMSEDLTLKSNNQAHNDRAEKKDSNE